MNHNMPLVIVTNEKPGLPAGIKKGRAYTEYKLCQLADKLASQRNDLTAAQLKELVKLCGKNKMVVVTTKTGSIFTNIQASKVTSRWTGWNGTGFGSFHPSNVKSFRIVDAQAIVRPEPVNADNDDTEFYY